MAKGNDVFSEGGRTVISKDSTEEEIEGYIAAMLANRAGYLEKLKNSDMSDAEKEVFARGMELLNAVLQKYKVMNSYFVFVLPKDREPTVGFRESAFILGGGMTEECLCDVIDRFEEMLSPQRRLLRVLKRSVSSMFNINRGEQEEGEE